MASTDAKGDLLWVLGMLAILFVAWFATGGFNHPSGSAGPFLKPPAGNKVSEFSGQSLKQNKEKFSTTPSASQGKIKLERGTGGSESLASQEYVVIQNRGKEPVTISGWSLRNSAGRWVVIPNGSVIFYPGINNKLTPIILTAGEKAVITTGRPPRVGDISLTSSFKTNRCTGYLGKWPTANFKPTLPTSCVDTEDEPGYESLSEECADFARRLNRCESAIFTKEDENELSNTCRRFLTAHYTYAGCLANHGNEANFAGEEWRVYLNQSAELWREKNETISLYDSQGRLVTKVSY